jgi:hypothetical protein
LPTFSQEYVDLLTHSLLANTSLHFDATGASDLMDHTGLIEVLTEWCQNDNYHKKDPGNNTDLSASGTGYGTVARNLRRHRSGDAEDPRQHEQEIWTTALFKKSSWMGAFSRSLRSFGSRKSKHQNE